jgi:response regulator NasT
VVPTPPADAVQPEWAQLAAIAVGVLMHRYSLSRAEAFARLQKLADAEGRSVVDQALRLVEAVELLASVK